MPDERIQQDINEIFLHAETYITTSEEKSLERVLFLRKQDRKELIAVTEPTLPSDKDHLAKFNEMIAQHEDIEYTILCMEAWTVKFDDKAAAEEQMKESLAGHPDRQEVLLMLITTKEKQGMVMCPIDRENNAVSLGKLNWFGDGESTMKGRFIRGSEENDHGNSPLH